MKRQIIQMATGPFLFLGILVLASCSNESKPVPTAAAPRYDSLATTQPGVAGGTYEETYIVEAIVSAVDQKTRHVTLKGPDGGEFTFTASPEIKNLPQTHVGDKVTATFGRRMVITVRSDNAQPSSTYENLDATARAGEKPKMLVAEETKKVARVKSIDAVNRSAELEFADGLIKKVPVRSDVDLSKYKVGDTVEIRVTAALTVLVETPTH